MKKATKIYLTLILPLLVSAFVHHTHQDTFTRRQRRRTRVEWTSIGGNTRHSLIPSLKQSALAVQTSHPNKKASDIPPKDGPTVKLRSYVYSIQRARQQDRPSISAIRSLLYYFKSCPDSVLEEDSVLLSQALEGAVLQAVRFASESQDYRMILGILQAVVDYCQGQPLLTPRIFGEAIESLSRTSANASKLKQVWQLAQDCSHLLTTASLTAFELNTMIRGLGSRGKVKAALKLYETSSVEADAYTASTLLNTLTESIQDQQAVSKEWTLSSSTTNGSSTCSPCWQHEAGLALLRDMPQELLNNHVFTAALKLNERASNVFGRLHYGSQAALDLLELTRTKGVSPDIVTCTTVLAILDKGHQWKAAVTLLDAMAKANTSTTDWSLPQPNAYAYSAVISACARCNQYELAMELLARMRHGNTTARPNTWVYNAALSACVASSPKNNKHSRIQMALRLLRQMERDYMENDMDTAPDTVSYNTALAVMDETATVLRDEQGHIVCEFMEKKATPGADLWNSQDDVATELLEEMKDRGISRDALTYHNAIKASFFNSAAIFRMLDWASKELQSGSAASSSHLVGRAGEGMRFVYNAALSVFALRGDLDLLSRVMGLMMSDGVQANAESISHIILGLGHSHNSQYIVTLIEGLKENESSKETLELACGIDITSIVRGRFKVEEKLYATAITECVASNDLESALKLLSMMRESGLSPSQSTLQDIAMAYAQLSISAAADESTVQRKVRQKVAGNKKVHETYAAAVAKSRAEKAHAIVKELKYPAPKVLSAVCRAFCASGLLEKGRVILQQLHATVLAQESEVSRVIDKQHQKHAIHTLPRLHRALMKICASKGNVTAALWFVEDIQKLSSELSDSKEDIPTPTVLVPEELDAEETLVFESFHSDAIGDADKSPKYVGMKAEDWKLLLIAASKSGHWKVCITTLQFLRPYLEALHPNHVDERNEEKLSRKYRPLSRALTAAILCFEMRSQYAWAVRAIDDWMEWSGRRPEKEAVSAAIRSLADRGRGPEISSLILSVLQVPASNDYEESAAALVPSYEEILFIGAITSLHNNGLYEEADDLYMDAIENGHLPYSIYREEDAELVTLDLHGMNIALAHSAVRIALQQQVLNSDFTGREMLIVTGRGINSAYQMRPVLRPEIQRMLTEEFYPPLSTSSVPGNMGALTVPVEDIEDWVGNQKQQRGLRMLAVADIIKNLTGNRLKRSLELLTSAGEKPPTNSDSRRDENL